MPALTDDQQPPRIEVAPSAVLELMWALHFIAAKHSHGEEFEPLETLRNRFSQELTDLRDDGLPQYSSELVVLAYRSGTLLDLDMDRFFGRVAEAASESSALPSLRSETVAEREVVRKRLEALRTDEAHRKRYVDLLSRVWRELEPEWQREGRAGVLAEAERWRRALASGSSYKDVLELPRLWPGRPDLDEMADAAGAEGRLVLNPSWFGGKIHVEELDGTLYVGRRTRMCETSYRKVAAEVSASIKAIADPTRLTILLRLARDPASVTELARLLDLSQPTVSAHVQVLREAGLIEERMVGRSAVLSASEEGLRRLFSRTEDSLVRLFRQ